MDTAVRGLVRGLHVVGSRGVVEVAGADARTFLQGFVTNDIGRIAPGTAPSMYAFMLASSVCVCADGLRESI